MANQERLIQWALAHAEALKLQVTHFDWTMGCLPSYTDLSVTLTLGGMDFMGRGTARNEGLSFVKAFAEAIERAVGFGNRLKSSNGVAAHSDEYLCQQSARNELIERDWFLAHFLTQTPFEVRDVRNLLPREIQTTLLKLEEAEIRFVFTHGNRDGSAGAIPVACFAFGERFERPFGCFLGLGCGSDLAKVAESAVLECFRDLFAFLNEKMEASLSLAEFLELQSSDPKNHRRLGMNLEYSKSMRERLLSASDGERPSETNLFPCDFDIQALEMKKLEIPFSEIKTVPLVVYRAVSQKAQDLFFGPISSEKINLERLSTFSGRKITWVRLL